MNCSTEMKPSARALRAAVDMEVHAACSTRTDAKAAALDGHFPAYDEVLDALSLLLTASVEVFDDPECDPVLKARRALASAAGVAA